MLDFCKSLVSFPVSVLRAERLFVCLLFGAIFLVFSESDARQLQDTTQVNKMINAAIAEIDKGVLETSLKKGKAAHSLAEKINYKRGQIRANVVIGSVYKIKRNFASALDYYLKANQLVSTINDDALAFYVHRETANLYQDWNVTQKAIENYLLALPISKRNNQVDYIKTLQILAFLYQQQDDKENTIKYFETLANVFRANNSNVGLVSTLDKLSGVHLKDQDYEKALELNLEILKIKQEEGDENSISKQLNEIGYIQRKLNRSNEALKYFEQALKLQRKLNKPPLEDASLLINMAVIHQQQQNFTKAVSLYEEAKGIFENENRPTDVAKVHIYLASTYYGLNDLPKSKRETEQAIKYAQESNSLPLLEKAYNRLSNIYEKQGNAKRALEAYKNYMKVRENAFTEEKQKLSQVTASQIDAEKQEKRLKLLIVDQELKNVELEKLAVEKQQQEQKLALLQQQQDLQQANLKTEQLEKQQVAQELRMAQEALLSQERNKKIADLQKEQEIQNLALKQKELEEKEREKALKLLESETKLLTQESKLQKIKLEEEQRLREEEKRFRLYAIGIILLVLSMLILIIVGYLGKRKANTKLAQQNMEITEQKEEIEVTASKLEMANKAVEAQKEELEIKNTQLTDSIVYAKRIQKAIMPIPENVNRHFTDHFSVFIPKDVVSGDFYWFTALKNKTFFAIVDCTGHGVPGAFMSMIGNTLLNQIIKERDVYDPDKILSLLHLSVRDALKQKDTRNADGMDVGICCLEKWEDGVINLKFSAAKIPLILVNNQEVQVVKGDRKSIGGAQKEQHQAFTPHNIQVEKGDIIYLITDGIIDMADHTRKRFGSKKLTDFLSENHTLPLSEQKLKLERLIKDYQKGADQRDDITLVGLKV